LKLGSSNTKLAGLCPGIDLLNPYLMSYLFKPHAAKSPDFGRGGFSAFMALGISPAPWIALCKPTSTKRSLSVEFST